MNKRMDRYSWFKPVTQTNNAMLFGYPRGRYWGGGGGGGGGGGVIRYFGRSDGFANVEHKVNCASQYDRGDRVVSHSELQQNIWDKKCADFRQYKNILTT